MKIFLILGLIVIGGTIYLLSNQGDQTPEISISPESEVSTDSTALPEDLPLSIPIYPEAMAERVSDVGSGTDERNIILSLKVEAKVSDVNTWYRGALSKDGWAVTDDKVVGGYVLLKGEKDNLTVFTQSANHSEPGFVLITERIRIKGQ